LREIQLPTNTNEDNNDHPDLFSRTLQQIERTHIVMTLKKCNGKIAGNGGAAALLAIPSTTLHSKMKKLRILKGDYFYKQS
jgi:formate hydrogenlyase transcriptional activator